MSEDQDKPTITDQDTKNEQDDLNVLAKRIVEQATDDDNETADHSTGTP